MAWRLSAPRHNLNEWWNVVISELRKKFQRNDEQNSYIFIQENAFLNVVCEMASIMSRSKCVDIAYQDIKRKGRYPFDMNRRRSYLHSGMCDAGKKA